MLTSEGFLKLRDRKELYLQFEISRDIKISSRSKNIVLTCVKVSSDSFILKLAAISFPVRNRYITKNVIVKPMEKL